MVAIKLQSEIQTIIIQPVEQECTDLKKINKRKSLIMKHQNYTMLGIILIFAIITGSAFALGVYLSALLCSVFGLLAILYYKGEPNTVNIFNRII